MNEPDFDVSIEGNRYHVFNRKHNDKSGRKTDFAVIYKGAVRHLYKHKDGWLGLKIEGFSTVKIPAVKIAKVPNFWKCACDKIIQIDTVICTDCKTLREI